MTGAINTALSGLQSAATRVNTSATRIAQAGTALQTATDLSQNQLQNTETPPQNITSIQDVDLATEIVNLKTASIAYEANLKRLMEQPSATIRRLGFEGKGGHPVLFPAALVPLLRDLKGDQGGRALIKQHGCDVVEVDDPLVLCDVDTPEALEALRSRV